MKQFRNDIKGKVPRLADRQNLILVLYEKQTREAVIQHEMWELRCLIRSDYWSVEDATRAAEYNTGLKKRGKK